MHYVHVHYMHVHYVHVHYWHVHYLNLTLLSIEVLSAPTTKTPAMDEISVWSPAESAFNVGALGVPQAPFFAACLGSRVQRRACVWGSSFIVCVLF